MSSQIVSAVCEAAANVMARRRMTSSRSNKTWLRPGIPDEQAEE